VDDIRFGAELPFQDSVIARAVNTVTAAGTIYFASAGNSGNKTDGTSGTWVGDFANGGAFIVPGVGTPYEVHSFQTAPSIQNYNVVNSGGSSYFLSLFWSDPENSSTNDYDVFQLNAAGTSVVSSSTNTQNGTQNPSEFAALASTGSNRVVVVRKVGAASRALYVSTGRGRLAINTNGFARGHSAAIDAIATAAVPASVANGAGPTGPYPGVYTASQLTETFSSDGPARKFHHPDGTPVTPGNFLIGAGGGLTQQYPVVTAADGVVTSVPGFTRFYGTSAAAPHAAAIAALIKGYNPTLTATQIRSIMASTALDIEAPGTDSDTGAGILRPVNALAATTAAAGAYAGAASGPTVESYAPANGFVDPGETVTVNLPITNIGTLAFSNLVATLQTSSSVAPLPTNLQAYGAIASGATVSRPFAFTAFGACGDTVTLTLQLQDGTKNFGTVTYTITLGTFQTTTTLVESFDSVTAPALPAGWTSTVVSGGAANWATSTVSPDAGPNSVFAAPLAVASEVRLDSPAISVPAGSGNQVSFRHRWNTESGYDGGVLEIAIGAGAFTDIVAAGGSFISGGYTNAISSVDGSVIAGRPAWSGSADAAYTTTVVALPAAAGGQNVRLRFRLASDSLYLATGTNVWRIDTLQRLKVTPVCATNGGIATNVTVVATGPIHRGQQSMITATVGSASGTPTGSVSVSGAGASCNVALAAGTGACQLKPTIVGGNQIITGSYTGSGGYSSSSGNAQLTVKSTLDVDNNGFSDAPVDGLLAARFLLGLRGAALTQGVTLGAGAQRTDPTAITNYLIEVSPLLDIDGDAQNYLLTDGLLIVRYLLGLRGSALVQGTQGAPGASRLNFTDIQTYLQGLIQ
ncbi:MAG: S8 family serine peptidase, partial [Casimicrobium sp.]